ncbi:MAG: protein-disulfide reductase DsbD family protein [Caulobacter sp.]
MLLRRLFAAVLAPLALFAVAASPARAEVVKTGHLEVELVSQEAAAVPGSTVFVALRQKIQTHWHTYWRNPGDAGDATKIVWTLPAGWTAGDIVWPTPERVRVGPLQDYAYNGEVLLPVPITVPASARPGQTVTLKAAAAFLVCEEICVPEDAVVTLTLPVVAGPAKPDPKWGEAVATVLAKAPKPAGLKAVWTRDGDKVQLSVTGAALKGGDFTDAYFFPYSGQVIDHAAPQAIGRGPEGLTLTLAPGFAFGPEATEPVTELVGVLATKGGSYEITAVEGAPLPGSVGLGSLPAAGAGSTGGSASSSGDAPDASGVGGLPAALLFAFLGGLILNLMPCVFPVLSMKAASLAAHAHDAGKTRAQGLAFLVGVVATFLALAGLLIAVRAGGEAVGWGFQLQSPAVVAVLALLMLLVALNLSGVFEVGAAAQGAAGRVQGGSGLGGAFLTGALAVIVAAPCTAPFMAGALGFALTQPPAFALLVFLALALGFAAPFVILAFAPGLLKALPRPGAWMDVLKHALAFPMYGAAAWLVWVFSQQAGGIALALLLAAAVLVAFAAWAYGLGETRRFAGKTPLVAFGFALAGLAGGIALTVGALRAPVPAAAAGPQVAEAAGPGLAAEPWSPERVAALQAEGKVVMVDFTADWCVTCKVNEKTALSGARLADAFKTSNAVLLKADWTKRDATIAAALAEHGRAGVPLYLVYPKSGGAPAILPQLLTEGLVIEAVEKAAKG